jgi:hypothetical protein
VSYDYYDESWAKLFPTWVPAEAFNCSWSLSDAPHHRVFALSLACPRLAFAASLPIQALQDNWQEHASRNYLGVASKSLRPAPSASSAPPPWLQSLSIPQSRCRSRPAAPRLALCPPFPIACRVLRLLLAPSLRSTRTRAPPSSRSLKYRRRRRRRRPSLTSTLSRRPLHPTRAHPPPARVSQEPPIWRTRPQTPPRPRRRTRTMLRVSPPTPTAPPLLTLCE